MVVDQAPFQQIVGIFETSYLVDIRNRTTNSIIDTVAVVLAHLQENYGQLMPHKILKQGNNENKTVYNPRNSIAAVFSLIKEILEFADITWISYTQSQAINIAYIILHRTGKFGLSICEWSLMQTVQKK